ncbi:acyltransferase family protein [Pseudomonas citronellolis]|uniref:acyltransferase family protein n=1 Tax=Pseudomonas citronellolis TaxID=53408 RepID=UPI002649AF24|nr:acyltransferase family protein [Pseudomonas citronellolis]MDN6874671.1 acyltransferase family protein [Pseudomonas citronellolis]
MRDTYIDNAKGVLIFLVVLGHFLEKATDWHWNYPVIKYVLTVIFMFHVPALVFLSGLTAKNENLSFRILRLFVMYVIFQGAYMLFLNFYNGTGSLSFVRPYWVVWFLLAMCFWYAAIPLIHSVRYPVLLSVAISVISGAFAWSDYQWSISRVMVFLPFFVVGNLYGAEIIGFIKKLPKWKYVFAIVVPVMAFALFKNLIENPWLYGTFNCSWLKVDNDKGVMVRAMLDVFAFASILCILCLIPKGDSVLASIGRNSLSVYLLHGFFALIAWTSMSVLPLRVGDIKTLLISLAASVVVTLITGLNVVDKLIRWLVGFVLRSILR